MKKYGLSGVQESQEFINPDIKDVAYLQLTNIVFDMFEVDKLNYSFKLEIVTQGNGHNHLDMCILKRDFHIPNLEVSFMSANHIIHISVIILGPRVIDG